MSKTNKKAYIVSLYFQIVFYSSWKKQKKQKKIKIKNDAGENRCIKDFLRGKCLEVCKTSQHNIRLCKVSKRRRELTFTFKGKKKKERGGGGQGQERYLSEGSEGFSLVARYQALERKCNMAEGRDVYIPKGKSM